MYILHSWKQKYVVSHIMYKKFKQCYLNYQYVASNYTQFLCEFASLSTKRSIKFTLCRLINEQVSTQANFMTINNVSQQWNCQRCFISLYYYRSYFCSLYWYFLWFPSAIRVFLHECMYVRRLFMTICLLFANKMLYYFA